MHPTLAIDYVLASDYVPFEFPTIREFIPALTPSEEFKFKFNPVSQQPDVPDQRKAQYEVKLAKAAYQAGIPFSEILESTNG